MSGTTSVPPPTFGPTGFSIPAAADVLAGRTADIQAAFGGKLNFTTSTGGVTNPTPQGQLAASDAAIINDKNATFLKYTQQVDPAYADGRMQDGIARIYFITRNPALPTVVGATCTGKPGVLIPTGATATATDGTTYLCTGGAQIPSGGSILLQFAAAITGPIACPALSLNRIARTIPGWDTISNPADGVLGVNVETRAAFEARRTASVTKNAIGSLGAILGAVLAVPGVLDAYVRSNDTASPVTAGGVTLPAYALYVAVAGGDPQAVATAIWSKKLPGGPYYAGNTTETVLDPNPGYVIPIPSYSVVFETPIALPILFAVSIPNTVAVPSGATAQIQAAIISAFAGADGGSRAKIGGTVYAARYYAGIMALGAWAAGVEVLLGSSTPTLPTQTVNIDHIPVTSAGNIAVTLV